MTLNPTTHGTGLKAARIDQCAMCRSNKARDTCTLCLPVALDQHGRLAAFLCANVECAGQVFSRLCLQTSSLSAGCTPGVALLQPQAQCYVGFVRATCAPGRQQRKQARMRGRAGRPLLEAAQRLRLSSPRPPLSFLFPFPPGPHPRPREPITPFSGRSTPPRPCRGFRKL